MTRPLLPDGLGRRDCPVTPSARRSIRRGAERIAAHLPRGWVATVDAAGLRVEAPSPAVLAVLAESLNATDPTFRAREIASGRVLASTGGKGTSWAWLYSVAPSGDVWLCDFEPSRETRADAEAAVLGRMGR